MYKKIVPVIGLILLLVSGAWLVTFRNMSSGREELQTILAKIKTEESLGTYKNTIVLYNRAIELNPGDEKLYLNLAQAYQKVNQYSGFESTCQTIISKFPDDLQGYRLLGSYYMEDSRYVDTSKLIASAPKKLQASAELQKLYYQSAFQFRYLTGTFDEATTFSNGAALVKTDGRFCYINDSGELMVKPKFFMANSYLDDLAGVLLGSEWCFVDRAGDKVLASKTQYDSLSSFSEGYAVAGRSGSFGYVDRNFNEKKSGYEAATDFLNGTAAVKTGGKWMLIDQNFRQIGSGGYDGVVTDEFNLCSRRGVVFAKQGAQVVMLDLKGQKIGSAVFENAMPFAAAEPAAVKHGGKWGFVDEKGKLVVDYRYDGAGSFSQGLAPVCINGKWGYIDSKGRQAIQPQFDDAKVFADNGIAAVRAGNSWQYIELLSRSKE